MALADFAERYLRTGNDRGRNRAARLAERAILRACPAQALDPTLRQEIIRYADVELGSKKYAPWLITYATWRGAFVEGCLPDNYVNRYLVPFSVGTHKGVLKRDMAAKRLKSSHFPDLAYAIRGQLYGLDGSAIEPGDFARETFNRYPVVYLKHTWIHRGEGIRTATGETFAAALKAFPDCAIQWPVANHPDFADLSPGAPPSLRITTACQDGPPRVVAAYLRMVRSGATMTASDHQVRAAVALDTGALFATGALEDWTPLTAHPDTNAAFEGRVVPAFRDAMEICVDHHARIPELKYIGWDVGVLPTHEIIFFEANSGHSDVKYSEANHGPIFEGLDWHKLHLR